MEEFWGRIAGRQGRMTWKKSTGRQGRMTWKKSTGRQGRMTWKKSTVHTTLDIYLFITIC